MATAGLDHFNIIAPEALMQEVRDFYVDVVGLQEGWRPDFGFPGHWLYAGERAVVHLMAGGTSAAPPADGPATGHLDHVAFNCTDLADTEKHLAALGVAYKKAEHPSFQLTQLFLCDPVGLGVELNFAG